MKNTVILAGLLAASVMPTALADTPENANSKAYAIRIQGEAVPAAVHDISYPARAATRSRDGHCDLLVQMDANRMGRTSILAPSTQFDFSVSSALTVQQGDTTCVTELSGAV